MLAKEMFVAQVQEQGRRTDYSSGCEPRGPREDGERMCWRISERREVVFGKGWILDRRDDVQGAKAYNEEEMTRRKDFLKERRREEENV